MSKYHITFRILLIYRNRKKLIEKAHILLYRKTRYDLLQKARTYVEKFEDKFISAFMILKNHYISFFLYKIELLFFYKA